MSARQRQERRFPRIATEHTVIVRKLIGDGAEGFTKTGTVGTGGCMIVSDQELGIGSPVELMISVHGRGLKAGGRVVYELPREGSGYEVGIEFLDISDDDRQVIETLIDTGVD